MNRSRPIRGVPPKQAFDVSTLLWRVFLAALVAYVIVGEIIAISVDAFSGKGLSDLGDTTWLVRGALAFVAVWQVVALFVLLTIDRLAEQLNQYPEVNDELVAGVAQTHEILQLAFVESIGIFGLTLFLIGGQQYDLFAFIGASALLMFLIRPSREQWTEFFRRMSVRFPNISTSPFQSY